MVIGSLMVVAAVVASVTLAAPFFNLFDYDICDDCSGESDLLSSYLCDLMCESEEECSTETTTESESSTTAGADTTTGAASTTAAASEETTAASEAATTASEAATTGSEDATTASTTAAK